jgi:hypothetical protein
MAFELLFFMEYLTFLEGRGLAYPFQMGVLINAFFFLFLTESHHPLMCVFIVSLGKS